MAGCPEGTGRIVRKRSVCAVAIGAVLGSLAPGPNVEAQEALWGGALAAKVDSLAEATLADGRVSGFSIGVKRGEDLLVARGYGFADLDNQVQAGPHTVYQVGSVTKQFTAAAIMQLVDDGKMRLDDPVTRFLPDFRGQGHTVTIRNLLNHTSGVRSYPSDDTPLEALPLDVSDEELFALINAEPFDFAPGESHRYSNAGYVLLGMIVAAASEQTYADYMQSHIFGPLDLTGTSVCDVQRVTPGRARGYALEDGALRIVDHTVSTTHMGAAGFLCSTVFDLISWAGVLKDGGVVEPTSYTEMVTPVVLSDGTEIPYGFGLQLRARLEGRPSVAHGGGVPGFSSQLTRFPEADLTIAVSSNTYGAHVGRMTDAIARWALGIPMPTLLDEMRSAGELQKYEGTYQVAAPDQEWTVVRQGDWLFLKVDERAYVRLRSQGGHDFAPQNSDFALITFSIDEGQAIGLSTHECQPMNQERCRTRAGVRSP